MCQNCTRQCNDLGTEYEPISVECVACAGHGRVRIDGTDVECDACDHGYFKVEGCPSEFCNAMSAAIEVSDWINEKQILPIAGGLLDQSQWIMEAARRLRLEDSLARAEN